MVFFLSEKVNILEKSITVTALSVNIPHLTVTTKQESNFKVMLLMLGLTGSKTQL